VLLAIFGGWILFVVDLFCILLTDKLIWLDELGYQETKQPKEEKAEEPAKEAEATAEVEAKEEDKE